MFQEFLIALVSAVIAIELIEHVVLPILGLFKKGKRKTECGPDGMKGKLVKIESWKNRAGIVLFHAERWQAVSDKPMQPGERAIVEDILGLTLKIKPYRESPDNSVRHNSSSIII
jgi:membrane-bound ClpP family serine protease